MSASDTESIVTLDLDDETKIAYMQPIASAWSDLEAELRRGVGREQRVVGHRRRAHPRLVAEPQRQVAEEAVALAVSLALSSIDSLVWDSSCLPQPPRIRKLHTIAPIIARMMFSSRLLFPVPYGFPACNAR